MIFDKLKMSKWFLVLWIHPSSTGAQGSIPKHTTYTFYSLFDRYNYYLFVIEHENETKI